MQIEVFPAPKNEAEQLVHERKAEARDREAYQKVLADPLTRRVLRQVLRFSERDQTGPTDSFDAMAVATGKRSVGNYLFERLRTFDPDGFVAFEREYLDELHQLDGLLRGTAPAPGDQNQGATS